nr:FkbM family methyltransferase [Brachyspira hyodysenteriae]
MKVGLIKTDLEGFEQPFLRGALNTIKKQKPILIISIYHNYNDFFDIKPMIEELNLGYKFKIAKSNDFELIRETKLIAEVY